MLVKQESNVVMDDSVRNILIKKGTNTNLIEWIEFIYPTLTKIISPINLNRVLSKYRFELGEINDEENKVTKNLAPLSCSGSTNLKNKYIRLLVDSCDNIGSDSVLSLAHELGHACCPDEKNYRLNLTTSGYLNLCYIEEAYAEFLKSFLINDLRIIKPSYIDSGERKKCFTLLNSIGETVEYFSYTKTYSRCQPLYFLLEIILGKDKKLINELYNAKKTGHKEQLLHKIRKILNSKLTKNQIEELYHDIYIGYICCSDYNKEVEKDYKLINLRTSYIKRRIEPEILKECEEWIKRNSEKIIGDIIEQTGKFTESILFSRLNNLENEDTLDLTRDLAFYINHIDISGNNDNRIELRKYFYSLCKRFKMQNEMNCYHYTDDQITGMLLAVLSNRCIKSSAVLNLKVLDPRKLKGNIEDFEDRDIAICVGEDYYKFTVNKNGNDIAFGLIGNGLNNKIIEETMHPDGIKRGDPDFYTYLKISKEID